MKSNQLKIAAKDKIGLSELFILKRMKPYIKPTKPHKHSGYFEIILINSGEGYHTVDMEAYHVEPPVVFFLKPGMVHHWEFTEKPDGYVLMFKPEFIQRYQKLDASAFTIDECIPLTAENSSITDLFPAIEKELSGKSENYKHSISSYLNILLIALKRLSKKQENEASLNSKVFRFNILVKKHFRDIKQVGKYADILQISSKHLNELCKAHNGKSPSDIIRNVVNMEAKRLLIYTDTSISDIATELGFEDASHFAKFFRKQMGISPRGFRQNRFQ